MKELSRYLASRAEGGAGEESWSNYKMMAYINQVVLVSAPSAGHRSAKSQRANHPGDSHRYADHGGAPRIGGPPDAVVEGPGDQSGRQQLDAPGVDPPASGEFDLRERQEKGREARSRKSEVERVDEQDQGYQIGSRRRAAGAACSKEAVPEPREGTSGAVRRRAKRDRTPEIGGGEQRRVQSLELELRRA